MAALDVLVVEDNSSLVRSYERLFGLWGWKLDTCDTLARAKRRLSRSHYDVVLLDIKLPDGQATDLLGPLRRQRARPGVVVMSAHYEAEHALVLMGQCDAFLPKPVAVDTLRKVIERAAVSDRGRMRPSPAESFALHHGLSDRETEVLLSATQGHDDERICKLLDVQSGTVRTYWKRIFKKTGEHNQRNVMGAVLRFALGGSGRRGRRRDEGGEDDPTDPSSTPVTSRDP